MLVQHLVSLGATNCEYGRQKSQGCQLSSGYQGKDISCPFVSGKLLHLVQEIRLQTTFSHRLVLNSFLIFHQLSSSCSYKITLIKAECIAYLTPILLIFFHVTWLSTLDHIGPCWVYSNVTC